MGTRAPSPIIGHAITVVAVVGMICYSLLSWDDMSAQIVTRQAADRHGASVVKRGVAAVAMPATLVCCALLLMLMPVWNRLVGSTPLRSGLGPREFSSLWSTILAMLSALLLGLHVGIVDMFTGRGPQLPQMSCYAMAAVLVGLAVICSLQQTRARRAVTCVLLLGSVLTAALAHVLPLVALGVGAAVMLGVIIVAALPQGRQGGATNVDR